MYTVIYEKPAQKTLAKMPRPAAEKIARAFRKLAQDPNRSDLDIKPLTARDGFRLRVGNWRAIYEIEQNNLVIYVLKIGPRGDVYK